MADIKLVTVDIDDTLLSSKKQILDSTKKVVRKAANKGVKVVLCTGRPLAGVVNFLNDLEIEGDDQYVITYNGGIIESVSGKVIRKHVLQRSDFDKMNKLSNDHKINFNVLDDQSNIYTTNHKLNWFTVMQAAENEAGMTILDPEDLPIDFDLVKGVFTAEIEDLDRFETEFRKIFSDGYYVVRSTPVFLEVLNSKANKGNAIRDLAEFMNIDTSQIMAVGDERNDLEMFNVAGTSICMGNGNAEVKKISTYVTSDNDHDGIAEAFEKFVL